MFLGTGINLGIDFEAGVNVRLQVVPVAFTVGYAGSDSVELNIRGGELTLEVTGQDDTVTYTYPFSDYRTLDAMSGALSGIEGISVGLAVDGATETANLLTLNFPYVLTPQPVVINQSGAVDNAEIETVRNALETFGAIQIQMIGAPENQEFQVRVPEKADSRDFDQEVSNRLQSLLEAEFGNGKPLLPVGLRPHW
jgi:preprotein translocase subunit SecF